METRRTPRTAQAIPPEKPRGVSRETIRKLFAEPAPTKDQRTRYGRSLNLDRIENAIRDAENGRMREITDLEYETISVDPHLASVLGKRIGALSALDYEVSPATGAGVDPERAAFFAGFVREQLAAISMFRQSVRQLAWGLFHGRAALEIMWRVPRTASATDNYRVVELKWVHPRRLSLGPERELRLDDSYAVAGFSATGVALRDHRWKFVPFMPQLFCDYAEREGLGPRCLYWSFFKRFSMREQLILLELFGKPWRIVEVDEESSADEDDLIAAEEAAQKLGGANTARMPRGTKLEVVSPSRAAGQIHREVVEEADRQISKLVLGQTATTGDGGSVPGADGVLRGEQLVILQQDANLLSEAIESHLTDAIVAMNFGEEFLDHAPKFKLRSEVPADKSTELARLKLALEAGLEVDLDEAYAISGFAKPERGAAVVKIEQPPAHPTSVQPPPPRPVIVYPEGSAPDPGEVKSIPSSGEGGLESPEEAPETPNPPAPPDPPEPPAEAPEATFHPGGKLLASLDRSTALELELAAAGSSPWDFAIDDCVRLAKQPSTINGSPESIIDLGVGQGVADVQPWIDRYEAAVRGKEKPGDIASALKSAHRGLSTSKFEDRVFERLLHGAMLGALDSAYEFENDEQVDAVDLAEDKNPRFARLPFAAAKKDFLARKVVSKKVFDRMTKTAKRRAFTVAGAANDEMLRIFRAELARQIAEGGQLREFTRSVRQRAESAGWTPSNPSHVETIYRTNVVDSYGAGRFEHARQPEVLAARPYWQIRTVKDNRQRRTHGAVDGWVLAADDPFWSNAYPPFGFACRCRVSTLSAEQVKRRGLEVRSGSDVSGLPDPGFESGR